MAPKLFKADDNKFVNSGGSRANKTVMNSFNQLKNNKSRNLMYMPNIKTTKEPIFSNLNAKKVFNYLRLEFIKALILKYFDLKSYVRIEIDISSYAIGRILNLLNLYSNAISNNSNSNKSDFC